MDFLRGLGRNLTTALQTATAQIGNLVSRGTAYGATAFTNTINNIQNLAQDVINYVRPPARREQQQARVTPVLRPDARRRTDEGIMYVDRAINRNIITTNREASNDGKTFTEEYNINNELAIQNNIPPLLVNQSSGLVIDAVKEMVQRIRRAVPSGIRDSDNGYYQTLHMRFLNTETNEEFSHTLEGDNITTENIRQYILGLMDNIQGSEAEAELLQVKMVFSERPPQGGGCSTKNDTNDKFDMNKIKFSIVSPKTSNNNCAFACYMRKLGIKGNKVKPDKIRETIGLKHGEIVMVSQLHMLSDHFQVGHQVYDGDDAYKVIDAYEMDRETIVDLVLMGGHYWLIKNQAEPLKKCYSCGKKYRNVHTECVPSKKLFYEQQIHSDGKKWVKSSEYKKKKKYCENDVIFFDIETFPDPINKAHICYAVGWWVNGNYYQEYGRDSMKKFVDHILMFKNKHICAYNGARFDFYPLMNEILKRGEEIEKHVMNNGRIISLCFGKKLKVFDLCLFVQSDLNNAVEDFLGREDGKIDFDHTKMNSWEAVEKYRDEVEPYLKNDVELLREVYVCFSDMVHDLEGVNIVDFCTLSHMAYDLWTMTVEKKSVEIFEDKTKYDYVSGAIYGGRCYPMKQSFVSSFFNKDDVDYNQVKESGDYLFNADATSLYPASMRQGSYPKGLSRWSDNGREEFDSGKIGFYSVKWDCPDKKKRVAVLPVRAKGGGMMQSIEGGEGVYTNVDIENAVECGYTFEFLGKCLVWDEVHTELFDEYVDKYFDIKNKNSGEDGNKSLRKIAKLMMNALYGKMLQGINGDGVSFCYDVSDVWKFRRMYTIKDWVWFDSPRGRVLRLEGSLHEVKQEGKISKPRHLGAFVLGYSRRIMLKYMKAIDPTLTSCVFTYHDTDSLHISGTAHKKLVEMGYIVDEDKAELGMLCSDIKNEGLILKETNIASKNYYYHYIDNKNKRKDTMKCKGLPKIDKLDHDKPILDVSMWEDRKTVPKQYTSFKRVKNPSSKQSNIGIDHYSLQTVTAKRTFMKNEYSRMIFKNGEWYPFGYRFD